MLVLMAAVTMLFAAFTSAYIVRKGISDDWLATAFPPLVWVNTLVLLASSLTMERARRLYGETAALAKWWLATTSLGVIFLLGQLVVWQQLAGAGIYLRTNPSSAFFYILTGAHGVHLLGGVAALAYFSRRLLQDRPPTRTVLNVTAIYWHFLDGLWVYLLLFIFLWR
jgi:cytochrome c oxidase subunit 3